MIRPGGRGLRGIERYVQDPAFAYGETVEIPAPVGISLDTEALKDFAE